jgi:hypothetical protein
MPMARVMYVLSRSYGRSWTQVRKQTQGCFGPGSARAERRYLSDSLYTLLPELTPLMQPRASLHTSLSLRFNVHWTRVSARPPHVPRTALPPGMYIRPGRPDIFDTLQSVITGVRSSDFPSGIVIGSCGPVALMDDASRAVGRVSWADWKDVGGVESIEECVCPFLLVLVIASCMLKGSWTGHLGGNDFLFIFFSGVDGQFQTLMAL